MDDLVPLGVSSTEIEGTYIGDGAVAPEQPSMLRQKFIGDTSGKIVRLADLYLLSSSHKPVGLKRTSFDLEEGDPT